MSEQEKRGRKRGSAPTSAEREEAATLYVEIGGTVDSTVYFGNKEISDYLKENWPGSPQPSPSGVGQRLNVENLETEKTMKHGNEVRDISWCGSDSGYAYKAPLWWNPETREWINASLTPREEMDNNVKAVVSDYDLDRWVIGPRKQKAKERQNQSRRQQGHRGKEGGRGNRKKASC